MNDILTIDDISSGYGSTLVLRGVSMRIPTTGIVAVLGRNGAGKTTLLQTIIGELPIRSGSVSLEGVSLNTMPTATRVGKGLGYVPQELPVFANMTVRQNLAVGLMRNKTADALDRVLTLFPKLGSRLDQSAGTLSGGERKMLSICRALLLKPRILLLDEPTEGVWVGVIDEIADRIRELATSMAVILVEQNLDLAGRAADYVYVLDRGTVAIEGAAATVLQDPKMMQLLAP